MNFCPLTGNDNIHALTSGFKTYVLRVDLADFDGNSRYAEYSDFKVASACDKYKITSLGTYFGTAGIVYNLHYYSRDASYRGY